MSRALANRVGLVARADNGGLASLTWEFARHLHPDVAVIVDLEAGGRGHCQPDRYQDLVDELTVSTGPVLSDDALAWLLDRCDVLYTAETGYRFDLWFAARRAGTYTVLHAMPELLHPNDLNAARPDEVWVPTPWELDRLPDETRVVPVPVAVDRFDPAEAVTPFTFVHHSAPAMEDRNGTQLVIAAATRMSEPCRIVIRGPAHETGTVHAGNAEIVFLGPSPLPYWEAWPIGTTYVMPRRFGGLSLPMQEAAAQGLPVISLDLLPQNLWCDPELLIRADVDHYVHMRGGQYPVHTCDPGELACVMDRVVRDVELRERASAASRAWAAAISWDRQAPAYRRLLLQEEAA